MNTLHQCNTAMKQLSSSLHCEWKEGSCWGLGSTSQSVQSFLTLLSAAETLRLSGSLTGTHPPSTLPLVPGLEAVLTKVKLTPGALRSPEIEFLCWRLTVWTWSMFLHSSLDKFLWEQCWLGGMGLQHDIGCNGGKSPSLGGCNCHYWTCFVHFFKVFCTLFALPTIGSDLLHQMCVGGNLLVPRSAYL